MAAIHQWIAEKATRLVFENLEDVYKDGSDLVKNEKMALASYYGGYAFTRASVGYVHAIPHTLGGLYGILSLKKVFHLTQSLSIFSS